MVEQIDYDLEELNAPWKKTQETAFKGWINHQLKPLHKFIKVLEKDLSDGLVLINLVEILSGKKFPTYNKRPIFRSQKLENVSLALQFLKENEGIQLVNINPSDIVDGKLKLILGLIWHLILHYSISKHYESDDDNGDTKRRNKELSSYVELTPRQKLLTWIQNRVPAVSVSNFTSDWADGRVLGCLVNSFSPGLCSDWYYWAPNNALQNTEHAMNLAEKGLGIPKLIHPEEIINPNIDEQSMMTYLSQFRTAKLLELEPKRSESTLQQCTTPNAQKSRKTTKNISPNASERKCKVYGKGLEMATCKQPNVFSIDARGTGPGTIALGIEGPSEVEVKCTETKNGIWIIEYCPSEAGDYDISIQLGNQHIDGSPFKVHVTNGQKHQNKLQLQPHNSIESNVEKSLAINKSRDDAAQNKVKENTYEKNRIGANDPFSVSIVGRNSPQYATADVQKNDQNDTKISCTIFNTNPEPPPQKSPIQKSQTGKSNKNVTFKSTVEIHNGKLSEEQRKQLMRKNNQEEFDSMDMDIQKSAWKKDSDNKSKSKVIDTSSSFISNGNNNFNSNTKDDDELFQDTIMSSTVIVTTRNQDSCTCM